VRHTHLKYVPIEQLAESATNYRRTHDALAHAELVASIAVRGVLVPLVVRQVTTDPDRYEVAAGHRRLRAARAAGIAELPVAVRTMDDREFAEIMITENLQRVDPDPLDEADAYQQLISALDYDVATLATKFGKSETYIRQRLVLTRLADEVRTALGDGAIELGHAVLLARVDEARQRELLLTELLAPYKMHAAVTRAEIADPGAYDEAEAEIDPASPPLYPARTRISVGALRVAMAEALIPLAPVRWDRDDATLVPTAGSCTACPKRTGANPALFDEFDHADDRCPDRACYAAKKTAYLDARVQACRSQAPALVVISTAYKRTLKTVAGLPVLRHHVDWAPATAGKRGSVPAVVVESDGGALEDWDEVGELRDVTIIKHESVKGEPAGKRGARTTDWNAIGRQQREADQRFWVGVRGVVRACRESGRAPDNCQPLLAAQVLYGAKFDPQVTVLLREELADPSLDAAMVGQLSDETLIDPCLLLSAAVLCLEDLETPGWYGAELPTVDVRTGTYPIPAGLVQLARPLGVDAPTAWAEAIAAARETSGAA
jgi:ParB/RepB/Spo0J family partition protein